jgi:hypothetical protein
MQYACHNGLSFTESVREMAASRRHANTPAPLLYLTGAPTFFVYAVAFSLERDRP